MKMANDREQQPVGREIPSFRGIVRAERGGRKPWTVPRLKTIRADVGAAPLNPNSNRDGVTCYSPAE